MWYYFIHRYHYFYYTITTPYIYFFCCILITPPGLYQQRILNIENIFNNDGNIFFSFSLLSEVNSMISKIGNQLIPSFMLVGQYSVLLLRSIFSFLMVALHLSLNCFHNQQHQYFVSILHSM